MNKFGLLALIWFIVGIYALIFREGTNEPPLFPHLDKLSHFGLFFIQLWLLARFFIQSNKAIPYLGLMIFALLYAITSELMQALLTETRTGSWLDGLADIIGANLALLLAQYYKK
ncbi:VanZ family protein [Mannheimia varigena]|uniref:VanZ family protein n=1 Tax=Mannheimia varigena TaxID=85404 RepID=UPI0015B5200F|nr:VanZ family protein [Mannheimia varigena]MDY2946753.1 VanZ family protein [Mannheimia varigena]QLD32962.1 VanZ family protein [Mannheimia varigena]